MKGLLATVLVFLLFGRFLNATRSKYDYYLGFFENVNNVGISVLLTTSDTEPVEYSIEIPGVGFYHNGTILAGDEVTLNLSSSVIVSSNSDQDKGIYLIASSDKITVIGQYLGSSSTSDSYFALPIIRLDSAKYVYYGISVPRTVVFSSPYESSILIVGTENNTILKLTTTQSVDAAVGNTVTSLIPGREYSFVIDRLQTFYIGSLEDLSGTKIVTDRPVSVLSGHQCGNVPWNVRYCDHLVEQILPTELWGNVYYAAPFVDKRSYTVKALAAYNNTVVNIYCNNMMESHIINEGEFVNRTSQLQEYCAIYSNKEVIVAQFSHGGAEDSDNYGDPMMILLPATNQYLHKFVLSTIHNLLQPDYRHFISIIVMEQYYQPNMIYLISGGVNRSLDTQQWVPIQVNNTIKAYATQINISGGVTQIFHTDVSAQLMTIAYGFTTADGYGHIGGIYISEGTAPSPGGNSSIIGDPHFSIPLPSNEVLCYSIQGYSGLAFNLISNNHITINAWFIDSINDQSEATWIGKLAVHVIMNNKDDGTTITFNSISQEVEIQNEGRFKASIIKQININSHDNITVKFTKGVAKQNGNPRVLVVYSKQLATFDVTFHSNHLDIDWLVQDKLMENSHGLMGQFMNEDITIDPVKQILIRPGFEAIPVVKDIKWQFNEKSGGECWRVMNIGHQGENLIEGTIFDYLVKDVEQRKFTFQQA